MSRGLQYIMAMAHRSRVRTLQEESSIWNIIRTLSAAACDPKAVPQLSLHSGDKTLPNILALIGAGTFLAQVPVIMR